MTRIKRTHNGFVHNYKTADKTRKTFRGWRNDQRSHTQAGGALEDENSVMCRTEVIGKKLEDLQIVVCLHYVFLYT